VHLNKNSEVRLFDLNITSAIVTLASAVTMGCVIFLLKHSIKSFNPNSRDEIPFYQVHVMKKAESNLTPVIANNKGQITS
jgi:hypothetical protein